jgi:glycopeptide antibiotics resistance protein
MTASCALAVLILTLTPQTDGYAATVQLTPLATIRLQLEGLSPELVVVNVLGNVAVFVPVGFFAAIALTDRHPRPVLAATGLGAALSLLCEVLQWTSGARSADVDDLLLNTVGAAVGALAGRLAVSRHHRTGTPTAPSPP